jgi:NADH-quinone oxidoreductase subunit K
MAYDKKKILEQAKEMIVKHKLFFIDDIIGQLFALIVLTVAAAESAIGLAILVIYYRIRGSIAIELINLMKG